MRCELPKLTWTVWVSVLDSTLPYRSATWGTHNEVLDRAARDPRKGIPNAIDMQGGARPLQLRDIFLLQVIDGESNDAISTDETPHFLDRGVNVQSGPSVLRAGPSVESTERLFHPEPCGCRRRNAQREGVIREQRRK